MPEIDVSDVLTDPDFISGFLPDSLLCLRNVTIVNSGGLGQFVPTQFPFFGVVTTDRGLLLEREASGSRIEGSISVVTRFRLQAGNTTAGLAADIVQWNGRQYTVKHVDDYSRYGVGFMQALCDLLPITG